MKYYSQDGQDKYLIEKIFNFKRDGFFIDIGAHDGVSFSNTYTLEKDLDWKGICVEPNPEIYKLLSVNRNSINLNCCIANFEKEVEFVSVEGYGSMLSGILDFFDKNYLKRIDETIKEFGGQKNVIKLDARPLKIITRNNNISYVDYCNIDVEGGEIEVLKSIDFNQTYIKIFSIENAFSTSKVMRYLKKYNYSLIAKVGIDEFYEKDSSRIFLKLNMKIYLIKRILW